MTTMDDETLRRLLAAAPPGPWRTMQSYAGPWWVGRTGPCGCQRPDCDRGFTVVDDEHGAELAAAAPALAAEVLRLRAVIEGRVVPPTPEEIEAHRAEGGAALMRGESLRVILDGLRHGPVHITADRCSGDSRAVNAFCDLIKAAPALAAEVLRLRAERDALRGIVVRLAGDDGMYSDDYGMHCLCGFKRGHGDGCLRAEAQALLGGDR